MWVSSKRSLLLFIAVIPGVTTTILLMVARIRHDVAVVGVLAASGTTAAMVPDLPSPRPRTIVVVKATMVDDDLGETLGLPRPT